MCKRTPDPLPADMTGPTFLFANSDLRSCGRYLGRPHTITPAGQLLQKPCATAHLHLPGSFPLRLTVYLIQMTLPITFASLRSADADQEKRDYSREDFGDTMDKRDRCLLFVMETEHTYGGKNMER